MLEHFKGPSLKLKDNSQNRKEILAVLRSMDPVPDVVFKPDLYEPAIIGWAGTQNLISGEFFLASESGLTQKRLEEVMKFWQEVKELLPDAEYLPEPVHAHGTSDDDKVFGVLTIGAVLPSLEAERLTTTVESFLRHKMRKSLGEAGNASLTWDIKTDQMRASRAIEVIEVKYEDLTL